MKWYYARDGRPNGPLTAEEFAQLVAEGAVTPPTLVWREGMADWQPYEKAGAGEVLVADIGTGTGEPSVAMTSSEPAPGVRDPASAGVICSECGQSFALEAIVRYGSVCVCTGCKEAYLGKLRVAVSGGSHGRGRLTAEEVLARDYEVSIGDYLRRGWAFFAERPGSSIGVTTVFYLLMMAANGVPYLGFITGLLLNGVLMAGWWMYLIHTVRGEKAELGDLFFGFSSRFWQMSLANLVPTVLIYLCFIPLGLLAALSIPAFVAAGRDRADSLLPVVIVVGGALLLMTIACMVFLTLSWLFAIPLVADKKMNFWSAMELSRKVVWKHIGWTLVFAIVLWLVMVAGTLLCLVGLLVAAPVLMNALALHYEKLFGELRES